MYFTETERVAIVKLTQLIIAADGKVKDIEVAVVAREMHRMGISNAQPVLTASNEMDFGTACSIVSKMSAAEKRYVCAVMGAIIAVDLDIDETETDMWSLISLLCDFPEMTITEALGYLSNM
jgi:hypothetical protein